MIWVWTLVILTTALVVILGAAALLGRGLRELDRIRLLGELDQAVAVPQLPRAGRFEVEYLPGPPFAGASDRGYELVDTGPLLLLSEKMAACDALEREIRQRCDEAEAKIPPRWR